MGQRKNVFIFPDPDSAGSTQYARTVFEVVVEPLFLVWILQIIEVSMS